MHKVVSGRVEAKKYSLVEGNRSIESCVWDKQGE